MNFLILPDCSLQEAIAVPDAGRSSNGGHPRFRSIAHASGRPWIVGHWADEDVTAVVAGTRRLVLFGRTRVDTAIATRVLDRARSLDDLDALAGALPGSVHLVASIDGRVAVQGSVSGTRQIFHTRIAGTTVAADAPQRLAELVGAKLDRDVLALRLLAPGVPWPLCTRTVWSGVEQLGTGCRLEIDRRGEQRIARWWRAPAAEVPLAQAAGAVRTAILDAVAVRTRGHHTVSADLSGGLDSTSLCFVAAAGGSRLLTHHYKGLDPANDDTIWAERAAALLPDAQHRFSEATDGPGWLAEVPDLAGTPADEAEGPLSWSRNRALLEHTARDSAARGATVHLMGAGGDELFAATPTYLWSLVRKRPLRGLSAAHRCRALNRWDLLPTLRGLADRGTFADTLAAGARTITAPPPHPAQVSLGWVPDPRLPHWACPSTAEAVRRLLLEAAATAPQPLGPDRVQHQIVEGVVHCGDAIRRMGSILSRFGVALEAPYLDDRVLEAALSVRVEDRMVRGGFKPVLAAALRGVVPDTILERRSKGDFSAEFHAGLYRNRRALLALCDDLRLARLGLVDAQALRAALLGPMPESGRLAPFEHTLACERWLRAVETPAPQPALP